MPTKLADRKVDAGSDKSFGLTEPGDLAEHRLRDRDGFVWLSSAFVEVVAGRQSLKGIQHQHVFPVRVRPVIGACESLVKTIRFGHFFADQR